MMVDAQRVVRHTEKLFCQTDAIDRTDIAGYEQICFPGFRSFKYRILKSGKEHQLIFRLLEIKPDINPRKILANVQIHCSDRTHTVTVGVHMSGYRTGVNLFRKKLINSRQHNLLRSVPRILCPSA